MNEEEHRERLTSAIERALAGLPPFLDAEASKEDIMSVGTSWLVDYLQENGYRLNATVSMGDRVRLFGSSQEVYYA